MLGFALLLGHLVGDYIVQNDWMAKYKTVRHPGPEPTPTDTISGYDVIGVATTYPERHSAWRKAVWASNVAPLACTAHCFCYTLAVFILLMPLVILPFWFYAATFLIHWPVDRYRLAKLWMEGVSYQTCFANGPLAPWSVIVVDNVFHLLTLYVLAWFAGLG